MKPGSGARAQRGGFVLGLIVGLLVGLALALGVALYIAKVPVPFMDKVGHRTAEQDAQEAERLKTWDPNAGLAGKPVPRPTMTPAASAPGGVRPAVEAEADAASAAAPQPKSAASKPAAPTPAVAASSGVAAPAKPARDPAAILAGEATPAPKPAATPAPAAATAGAEPFIYFVQAGAYSSATDAEQQRARLAMQGLVTKVTEREQSGRTVYRVRLGPFETREDAERQQDKLKAAGAEAAIVRVERTRP